MKRLECSWPSDRWRDLTTLVAVSGGADSVALLRGLHTLYCANSGEGRLIVAHFNHRLRGAASDADETFVRSLADQLGVEHTIGHANIDLVENATDGLEAAARHARYDFLAKAASEYGARYIATAHTADDQIETILFNILRGTGLSGLAGIPRTRPLAEATTIIRPLLDFKRTEIINYLAAIDQPFCDDETNQLVEFTRNRIRHELLPELERDYNPRVKGAIVRLAQTAAQADDFLDQEASSLLAVTVRQIPAGVALDRRLLVDTHPAVVRQMLKVIWEIEHWPLQDMSFEKWERLVVACRAATNDSQNRVEILPGGIRMETTPDSLLLVRN